MVTKSRKDAIERMRIEKSIHSPESSTQIQRLVDGTFATNANTFTIIKWFIHMAY